MVANKVPFTVYLDVEPGRARVELARLIVETPAEPSDYPNWAGEVRRLADVAGVSRWARRPWERLASADQGEVIARFEALHVEAMRACFTTGAALRGYPRKWVRRELADLLPGEAPTSWLELPSRQATKREEVPEAPPSGWWASLESAQRGCKGSMLLSESLATGQQFLKERTCGARNCLACARHALARSLDRYVPAFAVPLDDDHACEMYTVGSMRWVDSRSGYTSWRKGMARLCRSMVEGVASCGVPAGSWRGGVLVAETTGEGPTGTRVRGRGTFFAHAHLLVIRARAYPYGLSLRNWNRAFSAVGVPEDQRFTPTGRIRKAALLAAEPYLRSHRACQQCLQVGCSDGCPADPRAWLGLRELQRRAGVGEVGRHDVLDQADDGSGLGTVVPYLRKVHAYMKKAHKAGASAKMYTDPMCQWALKGTRRVQPFGCLARMHAGPSVSGREIQPGQADARCLLGVFDDRFAAVTAGARPEVDDLPRFVEHRLNAERLDDWRTWGDVDVFLENVERRARPEPEGLISQGWCSPSFPVPEGLQLLDEDQRGPNDDRFRFLAHRTLDEPYNLPEPTNAAVVLAELGDIWNDGEFNGRCADPMEAPPSDGWRQRDLWNTRGAA